jgi:hypothetical protein
MTIRVSPPANAQKGVNPIKVNDAPGNPGRTYSCAVGSTLDVVDHDAFVLIANGWHNHGTVCTTATRPVAGIAKDTHLIDSTLNAVIQWDGTAWRNVLTGNVV